jgi:hypothetical protein
VTETNASPQYDSSVHCARKGQTISRALAIAHADFSAWAHRRHELYIVKSDEMDGWTVAQNHCHRAVQHDHARHERPAREVAREAGVIRRDYET